MKIFNNYEALITKNGGQPQQHQSPQFSQAMQKLPKSVVNVPELSNKEMMGKVEKYNNQQNQNLPPFLQTQHRKPGMDTRRA